MHSRALAHIRESDRQEQSLEDHLLAVSGLTSRFAKKVGLPESGAIVGLLHDLGKYAGDFQAYLRSATGLLDQDSDDYVDAGSLKGRIDHSTAGAQYLWERFSRYKNGRFFAQMLFLTICSHHSGLIDCLKLDGFNSFKERQEKDDALTHRNESITSMDNAIRDILEKLDDIAILKELADACRKIKAQERQYLEKITDFPAGAGNARIDYANAAYFKIGLLLRFLFSCLLDADRIDSAAFEDDGYRLLRSCLAAPDWQQLIDRLESRLSSFKVKTRIDETRRQISDDCLNRADSPSGIYTLTVPTGGGKTLSSLRFALHHAKTHNLDRIVYIIPYTSIIEQNAEVVRKILETEGESGSIVLEHHSNIEPERETWQSKLLSANWETPIVFTTMVQFLETFFKGGTSSARRMHNLANAVLIFDEIQTLPIRCVHMFCHALNFLSEQCGTTSVLCTATQPLLNNVPSPAKGQVRLQKQPELMSDMATLFDSLKRVQFVQHIDTPMTLEEVSGLAFEEQEKNGNCLIIVNTKNTAARLYNALAEKGVENLFHLSTAMCPAHRIEILDSVKKLLADNEPVVLVSTQLIECGVDISFKSVIRLAAGLDSILQSAGRCNRNMELDSGTVHVVRLVEGAEQIGLLEDIKRGRDVYLQVAGEFREQLSKGELDLTAPEIIQRYFEISFYRCDAQMGYPFEHKLTGIKGLLINLLGMNSSNIGAGKNMLNQSFATAAQLFEAIDAETEGILVPYGEGAGIIAELSTLSTYSNDHQALAVKRKLLKKAQRFSVNLYPDFIEKRLKDAVITIEDIGVRYLRETHYSQKTGVTA